MVFTVVKYHLNACENGKFTEFGTGQTNILEIISDTINITTGIQ